MTKIIIFFVDIELVINVPTLRCNGYLYYTINEADTVYLLKKASQQDDPIEMLFIYSIEFICSLFGNKNTINGNNVTANETIPTVVLTVKANNVVTHEL